MTTRKYEIISRLTNHATACKIVPQTYGGNVTIRATQYGASFWDGNKCVAKFYEGRGDLYMRLDCVKKGGNEK